MDEHLDTSWCPVCDRLILPRKFVVAIPITPPITPLPTNAPPSIAPSHTSKQSHNANNKSRAHGGGLLHGTGRVRPGGGLKRDNSSSTGLTAKQQRLSPQKQAAILAQQLQQQQQAAATAEFLARQAAQPPRTRTVIDQAQTPLYCSEECRLADAQWSSKKSKSATKPMSTRAARRLAIGAHPALMNPAQASPPPPSPVLPPVPPNSWLAGGNNLDAENSLEGLRASAIRLSLSESEHSDSSSSGGSCKDNNSKQPVPPPMVPHPHRPSAPVRKPRTKKEKEQEEEDEEFAEGGMFMAAKRLNKYFFSDEANAEKRAARKEKEKREREQRATWDLTSDAKLRGEYGKAVAEGGNEREEQQMDPTKWQEVVYGYPKKANGQEGDMKPWVASTHRHALARANGEDPLAKSEASNRALSAPIRAQSALELYSKYPLFSKANVNASAGGRQLSAKPTTSMSFENVSANATTTENNRSATRRLSLDEYQDADAAKVLGLDPERYGGKKLARPRPLIPKSVEGRLVLPESLLRAEGPLPPVFGNGMSSASLPNAPSALRMSSRTGSGLMSQTHHQNPSPFSGLRRNTSEMSVGRASGNSGLLGRVMEEGGATVKIDEGEMGSEMSSSPGSHAGSAGRVMRERKGSRGDNKSGLSFPERGRINMYARTWSYDNIEGPQYDTMPALPVKQTRYEEVFIPDDYEPAAVSDPTLSATSAISCDEKKPCPFYIEVMTIHSRDQEVSRREIREVGRRRGSHAGKDGTWIEKEWEVLAIPERKRLFLFGGTRKT